MYPATLAPSLLAGWPGVAVLLTCLVLLKLLLFVSSRRRYREMRLLSALRGLDPAIYRHFPGLRLPHPAVRRPVHIPHVVVSPYGIFVIDTLRRRGTIAGGEYDADWTQRLGFHRRRIPNPLLRSRTQVEALMNHLALPDPPFRPLVVLPLPCVVESPCPNVIPADGFIAWIRRHKITQLDQSAVARADARLTNLQDTLNRPTRTPAHALHVQQAV